MSSGAKNGDGLGIVERGIARLPLFRLAGVDEIHRGEDAQAPGFREGGPGKIQEARNVGCTARHDSQPFEQPKRTVGQLAPGSRAAEAGERDA